MLDLMVKDTAHVHQKETTGQLKSIDLNLNLNRNLNLILNLILNIYIYSYIYFVAMACVSALRMKRRLAPGARANASCFFWGVVLGYGCFCRFGARLGGLPKAGPNLPTALVKRHAKKQ
jgi:hypothetical protein